MSSTGSSISIVTLFSSFSASLCCRSMMLPVPRSPFTENLTPSFVQPMEHVSPRTVMSRTMRWNSAEDILTFVL